MLIIDPILKCTFWPFTPCAFPETKPNQTQPSLRRDYEGAGDRCIRLLRRPHSVRALVRRTSDISELPPPSSGESSNSHTSLLDAFSGCQVIFHAAAIVEPWLPDPSKFFSVNVEGLNNVLQAAKETETIEKIIYTSSVHCEKRFLYGIREIKDDC
ncbi:hypothetical protein NC653_012435 [Populus alba x Populus x berolinensis]|uniref:3-beta hydroxysteroid dehydrogenase/isomerase domain-containing protein n=1 Tax=Populus alba x Populus x berolinensis TaxID=444605 RepID=A0AAD6W868_9ROSI|nr:hypothetical protein NC653_012435 [Populus alba x Populus x berolinensis]